jgi:membrane protease YdiL (CAAX protease family)
LEIYNKLSKLLLVENINQEPVNNSDLAETIPTDLLGNYSPNNPPWNSALALVLWLASVGFIIFLPALFLFPYLSSQNFSLSDRASLVKFSTTDPTAILIQIAAIIPAHILTLVLAWFIITNFKKYSFTEMLGWKWGGYKWWHTIALLVSVLAVAISTNYYFGTQDNELLRILRSSRYVVFLVAFMATFSAPIVEEVVYRGVLYSAFQRSTNIPLAIFLVTFVFALVHFPQYWGDTSTLITLTFLSLILTLIRVRTNSLLPCIFFHFVFNGIQSILLILQPYLPDALDTTKVEGFFTLLK